MPSRVNLSLLGSMYRVDKTVSGQSCSFDELVSASRSKELKELKESTRLLPRGTRSLKGMSMCCPPNFKRSI
jgi:hypothetical protein